MRIPSLTMKPLWYRLDPETHEVSALPLGEIELQPDWERRVALDNIGEDFTVSTVFLGLDHRILGDGPPLVFETMVFNKSGDGIYHDRCSTWEEALKMHEEIVGLVKNGEVRDEE